MSTITRASTLPNVFLLFCSLLISLTSATVLTVTIPASHILPNPNVLPGSTHATLTTLPSSSSPSSPLKAQLSRSSTLVFPDLATQPHPAGTETSYLLDIHCREYVFAPYRVDVDAAGKIIGVWETYRGHPWGNKGAEKFSISNAEDGNAGSNVNNGRVVVEARVLGYREFYEPRKTFSPLSLLKNPMILLGVFGLAMTFGLPYLMDNMDPEFREEFERQRSGRGAGRGGQGGGGGAAAAASAPGQNFDLAGWIAGTSPSPMDAASRAATSARENAQAAQGARRR